MGSVVIVLVIIGVVAAEDGKFVLDGAYIDPCRHIHVNGFHLRCVELKQAQLGIHAVVRGEFCHVKFEVGHEFHFAVELDVLRLKVIQ